MLTQQQIIALAVEAGCVKMDWLEVNSAFMQRFADLAYQRGVRDERDRCVKAFEKEADSWTAWPQAGAAKRKGVAAIYARSAETKE